jgi:hypothetical protein
MTGNLYPPIDQAEIIAAIGYTPEDVANKATDFSVVDDIKYPTTKAVENEILNSLSSVSSYFYYITASDIGGYYQMKNAPSSGAAQSITASNLAAGEHVVAAFATNAGYPNKSFFPIGWTRAHFHAAKTGGGSVVLRFDTYKRTSGGVETLIGSSDPIVSDLTGTITPYNLEQYNQAIVTMNTKDRIVTKIVAIVSSGTPSVSVYFEDAYLSRTDFPIQQTAAQPNTVNAITIASGVANIDLSKGDFFTLAMSENITSLTFSNPPGAGFGLSKTIKITQNASVAKTFAMPSSFKWAGGTVGVISTTLSAIDRLTIVSDDNGATYSAVLSKDIK